VPSTEGTLEDVFLCILLPQYLGRHWHQTAVSVSALWHCIVASFDRRGHRHAEQSAMLHTTPPCMPAQSQWKDYIIIIIVTIMIHHLSPLDPNRL